MKYVVTFGEVLMRFSPPGHERIIQCDHFHSRYSGAEANVAVSLAYYGDKVRFVSKFPDNILGDAAENEIRRFGVDTSFCVRGGNRLGISPNNRVLMKSRGNGHPTSSMKQRTLPTFPAWDTFFPNFQMRPILRFLCARTSDSFTGRRTKFATS